MFDISIRDFYEVKKTNQAPPAAWSKPDRLTCRNGTKVGNFPVFQSGLGIFFQLKRLFQKKEKKKRTKKQGK